jgi:hypothetical protein
MARSLGDSRVPVEVIEVPGTAHGTEFGRDVWPQTVTFLERWLFELPSPAPMPASGDAGPWPAAVVTAIAVLLIAGLVVVVTRRRRKVTP